MQQLKLQMERALYEKQCLEEEKQKALDRVKPLEKTIADLKSELKANEEQASNMTRASLEESARLK
eukprot:CAMPEP_0197671092 /NCGR_PEP_ID=MMETSP1338-20131121/75986_1 /TAXON_ID=43686 ORGANISM="Pelagodinium beii, Strain RCC1491" /NCGR_SAMPLE_ID=MMETSP1338 /ASSEMBLY_ACC=CAM_ASM_000754 /LENGTH=65 /DNA_ID=CAMNT_0043250927 /DNA_START=253 /DNA_END=447 /DNA_ORIENTATION=+